MSCSKPIETEALIGYWLGELPQTAQETLEEHVFACSHCSRRLEELAALAAGVRDAVRAGPVGYVVSAQFVDGMKRAGLRVREYRLAPGETVNCTILAEDHAVVGRMSAALGGVKRLDVLERIEVGGVQGPEVRIEDVPFDPAAGELLFVPSAAALKKMPASTLRVRLVAAGAAGEATLGEYTFAHTPQR